MIDEYESNFSIALQNFARSIYSDNADTYRSEEIANLNGTTSSGYLPKLQGIECRMSRAAAIKQRHEFSLPEVNAYAEARLYCAPDCDIVRGDLIEVSRAKKYKVRGFYAGAPLIYSSHMEVPLVERYEV